MRERARIKRYQENKRHLYLGDRNPRLVAHLVIQGKSMDPALGVPRRSEYFLPSTEFGEI